MDKMTDIHENVLKELDKLGRMSCIALRGAPDLANKVRMSRLEKLYGSTRHELLKSYFEVEDADTYILNANTEDERGE